MNACLSFVQKLWLKEEAKKGPSLVYQFQQTMESRDDSDEVAPLSNPKRKDLMRKVWLKVISIFVAMKTKDSLTHQKIWHGMQHNLLIMGMSREHTYLGYN